MRLGALALASASCAVGAGPEPGCREDRECGAGVCRAGVCLSREPAQSHVEASAREAPAAASERPRTWVIGTDAEASATSEGEGELELELEADDVARRAPSPGHDASR